MILATLVIAALQAGTLPVQSVVRDESRSRPTPAAAPRANARVIVDAGHGGPDVGGPIHSGSRIREKDITLQVALKLGQALRQKGIDVVYTRTRDTLIALSDRGKIANQAAGDLFISIHVNAANPRWREPTRCAWLRDVFPGRGEDGRRTARSGHGKRVRPFRGRVDSADR
jgi:N-acetylmuramoyl-L-alanine amidase